MPVPTRGECLLLMRQTCMPVHIQKHSLMVAELSLYLGRLLNQDGTRLDLDLLEAGALLHDIAKAQSLATGEHHDQLGARMLESRGLSSLAAIVRDHVTIDLIRVYGPVTESLIVNYADKRVKHDAVVTLEDRFEDLMVRYGKSEGHRVYFRKRLEMYLLFERKLFEPLPISPVEEELMRLSLNGHLSEEMEGYEGQEDYRCVAVGREIRRAGSILEER